MKISRTKLRTMLAAATTMLAGAAISIPAYATPNVATDSAVFVERLQSETARQLEPASRLSRGDRIVTIVTWYRMGGQGGFTITNPLPQTISYQKSAHDDEQVSVDGGQTWGRLADLRIGTRQATPEDVTHVRWKISARTAERGKGHIAYAGVVR